MSFARLTTDDGREVLVRAARVQVIEATVDGGAMLLLTAGVSVVVRETPDQVLTALSPEPE